MINADKTFDIVSFVAVMDHNFKSGYTFVGESHDFWEAAVVLDGTIEVTCDDSVYSLMSADVIFYPPLCFHNINRVGKHGARVLNFSFCISGALPPCIGNRVFSLDNEELRRLCETVSLINGGLDSKGREYDLQLSVHRLSSFVLELAMDHEPEMRVVSSESVSSYRALVSLMRKRIYDNLSLSDFAREEHISVSYIKHLFSRYAGMSAKSFYLQLRLNTAKELLKEGMSVSDISNRLNFSSPNYFSGWFKKETGVTPSRYKLSLEIK